MSTSYFYLRAPITSLRLVEWPGHDQLMVWTDNDLAGSLSLVKGEGKLLARMLADTDTEPPLRTHYGGASIGCVVTENIKGLDPNLILVSECGEIVTAGEVRAMRRRGASIGYHPARNRERGR